MVGFTVRNAYFTTQIRPVTIKEGTIASSHHFRTTTTTWDATIRMMDAFQIAVNAFGVVGGTTITKGKISERRRVFRNHRVNARVFTIVDSRTARNAVIERARKRNSVNPLIA